jgi:hypothetical protein
MILHPLPILFFLLIICSLPNVNSSLYLQQKVMAQTNTTSSTYSEGAKVLVGDTIQALKNKDINKAVVHLNLINQQLSNPTAGIPATYATNVASSAPKINSISTYKNLTYGITSIEYPSDWTINETNIQPNITSGFNIVSFLAPHGKNYPPGQSPALVQISLFKVVSNLTKFVHDIISNDSSITSYNTTAKLSGLPAYSIQHTAVDVNNSPITVLDVGTIISGKQLVAHYISDRSGFSTYLATALKIINSLRIDKAAIEQLTPPQETTTLEQPPSESPSFTPSQPSEPENNGNTHNNNNINWESLCDSYGSLVGLKEPCSYYAHGTQLTPAGGQALICLLGGGLLAVINPSVAAAAKELASPSNTICP